MFKVNSKDTIILNFEHISQLWTYNTRLDSYLMHINPFVANVPILDPLITREISCFYGVLGGIR